MAAWAEWRADTDPTNGRSLLAISSLRQTPTNGVSLGTLIGISGVFWIVGSAVGIGSHTAWRLRKALGTEPVEKS